MGVLYIYKMDRMIVIVILVVLLLFFIFPMTREGFDKRTVEIVPVNAKHYGLRGNLLRTNDIAQLYGSPYQQIVINPSGGFMWSSNFRPNIWNDQCKPMACPNNLNNYDKIDTCWDCTNE